MSTTVATPVLPVGTPNVTTGAPTTVEDQVTAYAKDVPDLIAKADSLAPDLAAKWTGKAMLASKTLWGSVGVLIATFVVKRYSLGWDQNTVDVVVGTVDLVALAALRKATSLPITGIFRRATVKEAVEIVQVKAAAKAAA